MTETGARPAAERVPGLPSTDADPFGPAVLDEPWEFHRALRDAGPVVYLTAYDVYAMGRYEHVHAALVDWQRFQSGAGVGHANFRYEKPWRPPSLLLEADPILMFLGAANRDPRHWSDPDSFDLGRDPSGHVGFGMGLHQCVGQHVARLEAEALLTALARRVERIEPAGPARGHRNNTLRAWESIPLRTRAA